MTGKKIKSIFEYSDNFLVIRLYLILWTVYNAVRSLPSRLVFRICSILPLQDKVVARSFEGKTLGDNPAPVMQELFNISGKDIELVWITSADNTQNVPEGMRKVCEKNFVRLAYEYATAKVWLDTHHLYRFAHKRKHQLFIETWHGGLGIKKMEFEMHLSPQHELPMRKRVRHTAENADVFLSNSDHLTRIYRSAFSYTGPVWKSGYPKNDLLISSAPQTARTKCRACYALQEDVKIAVYAPTHRDNHRHEPEYLNQVYDLDCNSLHRALTEKFGGKWMILIRLHPSDKADGLECLSAYSNVVIDATRYPDMQELILASDAFFSDYSSCIFDAALCDIPCFTYANDFAAYKGDRGVYYEMEELPFPYAKSNDELVENILNFNYELYKKKWEAFKIRTGLLETGHAAKDIANAIDGFIKEGRNIQIP